jgi:transposase InsO family protein
MDRRSNTGIAKRALPSWLRPARELTRDSLRTRPQTNGICERFHKTALNEFYRVAFRKKVYRSTDELQADLDAWIKEYKVRSHQ